MKAKGREEARGIARLGSAIALMSAMLLSCLVLISPDASAGPTYVHGPIEDTHWTMDDSPVIVIEDASLSVGNVLTVDPGVQVLFNDGANLYIGGRLVAGAHEGDHVVFTSNATVKNAGDWGSIIIASHDNTIRNARIEFAHRGLFLLEEAYVHVESVVFNDNQFAAVYSINSSLEMKDSVVMETGEWGIHLENSEAFVESSSIFGNGISFYAVGSSATFVDSTISSTFIDIVVIEDSHVWLVNSTFDEAKVSIEDDVSSVIVQWYVTVEVMDEFATHVPASQVTFSGQFGENITLWTDEFGLLENVVITQAELFRLESVVHNPYLIIARKGEHEAEAMRTITSNTWVEMLLSADLSIPHANAGENMDVDEDERATLSASGSTDNDPDFMVLGDFVWKFEDQGSSVRLNGLEVHYVFETPGTYWITLIVKDPSGNSDSDTVKVVVRDTTPPSADAGGFRSSGVGDDVLFDAGNSTDNNPEFWDTAYFLWVIELDEGTVELPGRTVNYAFESAGNYTVTLRVEDDGGNVDSDSIHVKVKAPTEEVPLIIPLGLGLLAAAFVGGLLNTEAGKMGLFKFLLIPLYVKLKRKDILDHFLRGQIYGYIKVHPGEHYTAIKNNLQLNNGTLTYHLDVLEREGLIVSKPKGSRRVFYPVGMRVPDNGLHAIQEDILERVNESPGMSISDIARLLGISRQLTNYHVKKLVGDGKIDIERKGVKAKCFPSNGNPPRSAF